MDVALKELSVTLPSVAANDFAYEFLPTLALPANWIITPSKTEMFNATSATLEGWLEEAIRACEGTGGLTGQNISRK